MPLLMSGGPPPAVGLPGASYGGPPSARCELVFGHRLVERPPRPGVFLALAIMLGIPFFSLDLIFCVVLRARCPGRDGHGATGAGFTVSAIAAAVASVACLAVVPPPW